MTSHGEPPDDDSDDIGYQNPPKKTRFAKGQSGNPAGRPRGSFQGAPYEAVLGQMVTIRGDGVERRVRADEAFLLNFRNRASDGDKRASRAALTVIDQFEATVGPVHEALGCITRMIFDPGSVTRALLPLRMGCLLDAYRATARMMIEPWLVEAALARLDYQLTAAEQRIVIKATRTPHKVRWPKWWSEYP